MNSTVKTHKRKSTNCTISSKPKTNPKNTEENEFRQLSKIPEEVFNQAVIGCIVVPLLQAAVRCLYDMETEGAFIVHAASMKGITTSTKPVKTPEKAKKTPTVKKRAKAH